MEIREYIEKETGMPTAEVAFTKPQPLPFIAIIDSVAEDGDDFRPRTAEHNLTVELYAERIDEEAERKLENALRGKGWKCTKERMWISTEKMFETVYTTNFMEKR